jgi:hypothetical protein
VRPGDDVVLVVGAKACEVRAMVRRSDGAPDGGFDVDLVSISGPTHFTGKTDAQIDGDAFVVSLGPSRTEPFLRVVPHDASLAPAAHGPLSATAAGHALEFVLVPWATVPVEVLDSGGAAVPDVGVALRPHDLATDAVGGMTDAAGRVVLERCAPGPSSLRVHQHAQKLYDRDVVLGPGTNGTLLVRLP